MKKYLLTLTIIPALLFSGCASVQSYFNKLDPALIQSFGNALRSLEGAAVTDIPKAIIALRNQWLPAGKQYDDFVAGVIRSYLSAHPKTNSEIAKVLEALATQLQQNP